jgi:phosphodiesterase/alkaline phosphatase D-like protein
VLTINPNLAIEKDQILVTPVSYEDFTKQEHFMKRISINNLSPTTAYYYGITHPQTIPNSATMAGDVGKFTTPPVDGSRVNFTIATGSCALTGSRSGMFSSALDLNPVLFIHTGDFHYEDLDTLDIDERLQAYDKVMGSQAQRLLYMRTIFTYTWDDHDWLGNNQDSKNVEAATAAKESYSLGIPHYELGAIQTGVAVEEDRAPKYQAFTIGTVRFIISDLRSESLKSTENFAGQIYSTEQKNWLFNELSQAENYDFVVWVTSRPWTDPDEVGSDSWGGFVNDRNELAFHIASTIGAGPKNLLVLSGDNHMVAFDDGSSTDYSNQNEVCAAMPSFASS